MDAVANNCFVVRSSAGDGLTLEQTIFTHDDAYANDPCFHPLQFLGNSTSAAHALLPKPRAGTWTATETGIEMMRLMMLVMVMKTLMHPGPEGTRDDNADDAGDGGDDPDAPEARRHNG